MRAKVWVSVSLAVVVVGAMVACGDANDLTSPTTGTPEISGNGNRDRGPLERVQFIHWKKGYAKPDGVGGPKGSTCYAFIARGARWQAVEPWFATGSNHSGVTVGDVRNATGASIVEWETELSPAGDILGSGGTGGAGVNLNAVDNRNVVEFANYPNDGVIAVTNVWGFFSGPASTREIVEWDMILNTRFGWSTNGAAGEMDLLNILTHEIGHAMGMGHPSDSCTEETMYRFASEAETKKRTIESGDIAGINELY